MRPSEICKSAGFKLVDLSKATGVSTQTLTNWSKDKPDLFRIIVAGVAVMKENQDLLKIIEIGKAAMKAAKNT